MDRRRALALAASVLVLLLLIGGGLLFVRTRTAREQIRAYVERALARELNLPVHLGGVSLSLGVGSVQLKQLTISDRPGGAPLLEADRIRVSLALAALLRGEVRLRSLAVEGPRLTVEDTPAFRRTLARVAARLGGLARAREAAGFPVRLHGGAVRYRAPAAGLGIQAAGLSGRVGWLSPERARVELSAGAIEMSLGGWTLGGLRLEADARLGRGVTEVERIRLDRNASTITLAGVILTPGGPPRVELTATGEIALDELARDGWSGRLSVAGKLFGEGLPRAFEGRLGLADGSIAGMAARLVTATVVLRPERLEVLSLSALAGGGALTGSGLFDPPSARWRGDIHLRDVDLANLLQLLGHPSRWTGRLSGTADGSGRGKGAGELALRLNLTGRDLRLAGEDRRAEGALLLSARQGVLRVERLTLGRRRSRVTLRGTANLRTRALALTVTAAVDDLATDLWPFEVKTLAGRLSVSGRVSQSLTRPRFSGQLTVRDGGVMGWRADSLQGPLEIEPTRLATRGLRLSTGRTTATLSGEAWLAESTRKWGSWREDLHLAVRADLRGRLEDLLAWSSQQVWPVAGPMVFQARLSGTPSDLKGGGQLDMRELRVGPERLEGLRAVLAFKGSELSVPRLTARRGGVPLQAEGAVDTDGRYRFSLLPVTLDLATIPSLAAAGGRGSALLRLRGAGKWPERRLEAEAGLTDAGVRDIELGKGTLGFALDGSEWRWELSLARGVRARGVVPRAFSGPVQADVAAANLDLAPFLSALRPRLPFSLTARTDGRATLRATLPGLADPTGQIELTALRGQAGEVAWRARDPARLALAGGTLRFESLELAGQGLAVAIGGSIRPGKGVDLELSGHAPFAIVAPWVPPLADLRGAPEAHVFVAGLAQDVRVAGRAELHRVDVKLKPVPLWLAVEHGDVRFDTDGFQYTVGEASAAGGRLEGQGTGQRDGTRWRHTLDFRLDKAQLEPIFDQLHAERRWASGDLFARGSLAFETAPGQAALSTLRGRASLTLEGGSLSSYPALVRIFGLLATPAAPYRLPDLTRERMPYKRISADFTVSDGVMETKDLLLDSEVVRLSGVGKVMPADQTVDVSLAVRPLEVLEQGIRRIPLLGRLLPQEQSLVVVYVDMQGHWADPAIRAAPVKSLSDTVVDILLLLLKAPARVITPAP